MHVPDRVSSAKKNTLQIKAKEARKLEMLTLFALPKPFKGLLEVIQLNAIASWTCLRPRPEIILFGDEERTSQVSEDFGLLHVPEVACNEYGTPLLDDLFEKAQKIAKNDLLCYVNADIILLDDFFETLSRVPLAEYMLIGRRLDLDLDNRLDFSSPLWKNHLRDTVKKKGKLHGHTGIDYFVFLRGLFRNLPPLAIGRTMWDNWLVYRARSQRVPVIDATLMVTAIHQNHNYYHHSKGEQWIRKGPEAVKNLALSGGLKYEFTIKDATLVLTPEGLKKPEINWNLLYRRLETLSVLRPGLGFVSVLAKGLFNVRNKIRETIKKVVSLL